MTLKFKKLIKEPSLGYQAYRYETHLYSSGYDVIIRNELRKFDVIKRTQHGIWIQDLSGNKRFVKLDARKKFACLTISNAKESFIKRKELQIRILEAKLKNTRESLFMIEHIKGENNE